MLVGLANSILRRKEGKYTALLTNISDLADISDLAENMKIVITEGEKENEADVAFGIFPMLQRKFQIIFCNMLKKSIALYIS